MERLEELIVEGLACFNIGCDAEGISRLASYVRELVRWNLAINLVGLKEGGRIVAELVYDAFFLHSRISGAGSLLDLGSGSGVVAVPLAILDPDKLVFSVEKSLKKALFQRHVKRLLQLSRLEVVQGRAEDIPPLGVDFLVAKAFGPVRAVLDKGGRHLLTGGSAFIVKGRDEKAPIEAGFRLERIERYGLPATDKVYQLLVYKKVP